MKFRGWQKILIFAGIKFRDLAKKIAKPQNFLLPAKISDNKVVTNLDVTNPTFITFEGCTWKVVLVSIVSFLLQMTKSNDLP